MRCSWPGKADPAGSFSAWQADITHVLCRRMQAESLALCCHLRNETRGVLDGDLQ